MRVVKHPDGFDLYVPEPHSGMTEAYVVYDETGIYVNIIDVTGKNAEEKIHLYNKINSLRKNGYIVEKML